MSCSPVGKESIHNTEDPGLIPGLGRSLGEGNGNPSQYYCLGNPMDRGTWQSLGSQESDTTYRLNHLNRQRIKAVLCYSLEGRDGVRGGREAQEGGGVCILMADSRCCMEEASTIV